MIAGCININKSCFLKRLFMLSKREKYNFGEFNKDRKMLGDKMDLLQDLNQQQKEAVTAGDGPLLIMAGAGSGKTKVLVSRVAYLINQGKAAPWQIMAVTFTNKAAQEMKDRLEALTGENTGRMWIGTFHSLCVRILRRESAATPFLSNFTIYDENDKRALLKKCLAHYGLLDDEREYSPAKLSFVISDAKNRLISAYDMASDAANQWQENAAKVYREYQRRLRENNALDFDDLLMETVLLLEKNQEVRREYQARFRYILVDEYQDTNHCQYRLVRALTNKEGNIFVVGDSDQSIYCWRGADIRNILDFEKDYPHCRVIKLTRNYRSTQNILDAANALIANNQNRREKDLFTDRGAGEKPAFYLATDDREEANFVVRNIASLIKEGYTYKDFAILYRTHAQSRPFEEECLRHKMPYRTFGGIKFYERKEIKDSLAYLRAIANPADSVSLERIYNEPKRKIGEETWRRVNAAAAGKNAGVFELLGDPESLPQLRSDTKKRLREFYEIIDCLINYHKNNYSIADLLERLWQLTGYFDHLREMTDGDERLRNLEQLYQVAADFDIRYQEENELVDPDEEDAISDSLLEFLGQVSLSTDALEDTEEGRRAQEQGEYLTLATLHSAKGLEFPVVFIVGMEEGVFPHERSISGIQGKDNELEEERRLCYVGITRARDRLFMTAALKRRRWDKIVNNPISRFAGEIPKDLMIFGGNKPAPNLACQKMNSVFAMSAPAPRPKSEPEPFSVGDKVRHEKFGEGVIVSQKGSGEDLELGVAFPGFGIKQLLWRYARMKKL